MTHVTCRLTAQNRDQPRKPTLGNRVRASFLRGGIAPIAPCGSATGRAALTCCSWVSCAYCRRPRTSNSPTTLRPTVTTTFPSDVQATEIWLEVVDPVLHQRLKCSQFRSVRLYLQRSKWPGSFDEWPHRFRTWLRFYIRAFAAMRCPLRISGGSTLGGHRPLQIVARPPPCLAVGTDAM